MNKPKQVEIKINRFFDKNFFDNAFNNAYTITDDESIDNGVESDLEASDSSSNVEVEETQDTDKKEVQEPTTMSVDGIGEITQEQIKEWYEKANQKEEPQHINEEKEIEYPQDVKDALELYKYLEENPHLIQSLQGANPQAYQDLNQIVPDETTRRIKELEDYIDEQRYESYIRDLKGKFSDFDEDKVLEYAEKHDVTDLEVAYKALKADSIKPPNMDALRQQIREEVKKEIMEELKSNSLNTQSIISTTDQANHVKEEPQLTAKQMRVAQGLGMTASEYAKWAK